MRRQQRRRARRHQGFTLIEVMISIGVMTIGAMGVIALQQHAIRSNSHARQLSLGMQIAQVWIERLKQDAHSWTQAGDPATVLIGTRYLTQIQTAEPNEFIAFADPASNGVAWANGSGTVVTGSRAFDYFGNDLLLDAAGDVNEDIHYCAAFRPAWVYFGRAMRVDVRVWWPRGVAAPSGDTFDMTRFGNCDDELDQLDPGGAANSAFNQNGYHVVYLSTVIRMNPVLR